MSQPQSKSSSPCERQNHRNNRKNASRKEASSNKQLEHGLLNHSVPSGNVVMHGTVEHLSDVDRRPLPLDVCVDSGRMEALPINQKTNITKKNRCMTVSINSVEDNGSDESSSKISYAKPKLSAKISGPSENLSPNSPPVPAGMVLDNSISIKASTKAKLSCNASSSTHKCIERRTRPPPSDAHENPHGLDASYSTLDHNGRRPNSNQTRNLLSASVASPDPSMPLCSRFPNPRIPEQEQVSANQNDVIDSTDEIVADAVLVNDDDVYEAEVMSDSQPTIRQESKAPQVVINQMYSSPDDTSKCCENRSYAIGIPLIVLIIALISIITGITVGAKGPTSNTYDVDTDNSHPSWDDHSQNSDLTYNSDTHQYFFSNGTLYEVGL